MDILDNIKTAYEKDDKRRVKQLLGKLSWESAFGGTRLYINQFINRGIGNLYYAYLTYVSLGNYPSLYDQLKDVDMSKYADYANLGIITNAIEDTTGDIRDFYIDLLKYINIDSYLDKGTTVSVAIDVGLYNSDDVAIRILEKDDSKNFGTFITLIMYNYVKDFMRVYNLAKKLNRIIYIDYMDSVILNQV